MDNYTIGDWTTEAQSAAALDRALLACGLWTVYREVCGTVVQPRPSQPDRSVRIDRLLVPNERLAAAGWKHGVIGVEIKRSGVKIGQPIAQAMDYSRATWTLPVGGIRVWLDWIFLWPVGKQHGTTASILAQNRIGTASADQWTTLHLRTGEHNVLRVGADEQIEIGTAANGQKVGSR